MSVIQKLWKRATEICYESPEYADLADFGFLVFIFYFAFLIMFPIYVLWILCRIILKPLKFPFFLIGKHFAKEKKMRVEK